MLSEKKMKRINELANKKKTTGLSIEEAKEQTTLRQEYLEAFRSNMRETIESVKVVDPEGNDVTPEKVKLARANQKPLN